MLVGHHHRQQRLVLVGPAEPDVVTNTSGIWLEAHRQLILGGKSDGLKDRTNHSLKNYRMFFTGALLSPLSVSIVTK